MPLSENARDAVLATREMPRNARQRQYRYIASLLADRDVAEIRGMLAGELHPRVEEVARLHEVELWRDRLLSGDESHLAAFVERHPGCDRTNLRRLVRNAKKERELEKPPKSARQLFRYLRQLA